MLPKRIKELRSTIMTAENIGKTIPRETIIYHPDERKSPILRHAEAVQELFDNVSINHIPGEKIAGNNTTKYSPRPNHLTKAEMEEIKKYPVKGRARLLSLVLYRGAYYSRQGAGAEKRHDQYN
jgi:hypothetical protein